MNHIKFLAGLAMAAGLPVVHATTFSVTRLDDPSPNGCLVGDCSLREAVLAANSSNGSDVILVPSGTYAQTRGTLTISNSVQILGSTTTPTIIDGDGVQPLIKVTGAPTVLLASVALQAHGEHALDLSRDADTLLDRVLIADSDSQIWAESFANGSGSLEIRRSEIRAYLTCGRLSECLISDSSLLRLQVGDGDDALTQVELTRVIIDGSLAADGSTVVMQTSGAISLTDTTITQTNGGFLITAAAPSQVTINGLRYVNNSAPVRTTVATQISVADSEFRSNTSAAFGGGPGAIQASSGSSWVIDRSTFDRN